MNFRDLDAKMRTFEATDDHCVPAGIHMVARLDGRSFTKLIRQLAGGSEPMQEDFRDHMIAAAQEVMRTGFHALYGYVQGDEMSILLHRDDTSFGRKLRKLNSLLAATASAALSLRLGRLVCFDCRISQLPSQELVVDYFRWRAADCERNSVSAYCQWALERSGLDAQEIAARTHGLSLTAKRRLLRREHGIDFGALPVWKRRGLGLFWEVSQVERELPDSGVTRLVTRRHIHIDFEIAASAAYGAKLHELMSIQVGEQPEAEPRSAVQPEAEHPAPGTVGASCDPG